jgi:hypothetical protein
MTNPQVLSQRPTFEKPCYCSAAGVRRVIYGLSARQMLVGAEGPLPARDDIAALDLLFVERRRICLIMQQLAGRTPKVVAKPGKVVERDLLDPVIDQGRDHCGRDTGAARNLGGSKRLPIAQLPRLDDLVDSQSDLPHGGSVTE